MSHDTQGEAMLLGLQGFFKLLKAAGQWTEIL